MKPQHVIYLSGSGVVLYSWDQQRYVPVAGYRLPDDDPAPVVACLRQNPAAEVAIVVDILEEEHSQEKLPRLGRRDQQAMLERKLARTFPRTVYRTAAVQGRLPDDPQMNQVLLSGLSKADHLKALQGLLAAARVPVSGVCSPALLSMPLLDKLRPANPANATLIVSRQREGSLRLSFFRGRDLVGSRLMRRTLAAPPGDFERLAKQLEDSIRYFDAAFAPSATNPVDVLLLCESGVNPALAQAQGTGHEGFRLHVPDPVDAGRRLGLHTRLEEGNADLLFVELLRRHRPTGDFAPPEDRRYFQLHQARTYGAAACLVLAAGALTGSALEFVGILDVRAEQAAVQASAGHIARQLATSPTRQGYSGADPLEMQRVGTAWQLLRKYAVEPEEILQLVSRAVEENPQVTIRGIDWTLVQPMVTAEDEYTGGEPESATLPDGPDAAATAGDPLAEPGIHDGTPPGEQRVRLTIRGHVEPFAGDYLFAFRGLRTFMASLDTDPRVISVRASKEPLDVRLQSTISGEMTPGVQGESAAFTLNVLLSVKHESA